MTLLSKEIRAEIPTNIEGKTLGEDGFDLYARWAERAGVLESVNKMLVEIIAKGEISDARLRHELRTVSAASAAAEALGTPIDVSQWVEAQHAQWCATDSTCVEADELQAKRGKPLSEELLEGHPDCGGDCHMHRWATCAATLEAENANLVQLCAKPVSRACAA